MKTKSFLYILIPAFLFFIGGHIASLGALVYASLHSYGFSAPAQIALIQALAALGAILVSEYFLKKHFKNFYKELLIFMLLFCVFNTAYTFIFSEVSSVLFFLRLLFGGLILSIFLSQIPRVINNDDISKGNQTLQIWLSISSLVGFGLAPLLANSIKFIFAIDLILNLLSLCFIVYTIAIGKVANNFIVVEPKDHESVDVSTNIDRRNILLIGLVTFLLWVFGGFFHVVEVPLLLHRFNLSQSYISSIFILTLILNIATISLLKSNFVHNKPWLVIWPSIVAVATACFIYIYTDSMALVLFSIILIGASNGAFNFSQTAVLQKIVNDNVRLKSFIFARLVSQLGIMAGVLIAGSGLILNVDDFGPNHKQQSKKLHKIDVLLQKLPKEYYPYKYSDTGAMLVMHQIYETLFQYDSRNNLNPKLVETLIWGENNKSLLLKIKPNVFFSDGTELRAQHVIYSLEEARRNLGKSVGWAFGAIKNINKISDFKLKITFNRPFSLMPAILASSYFSIFKKTAHDNLVGTGPYKFAERNENKLLLTKNSYYHNKILTMPDEILFHDKFDSDVKYTISDVDTLNISKNKNLLPLKFKTLQIILFIPNLNDPILKTKSTRCSLVQSLTNSAIKIYSKWKPADIGLPFYSNFITKKNNKPKIINNLEETIVILYSNSTAKFNQNLNELISKQLKSKGLNVVFKNLPIQNLIKKAKKGHYTGLMIGFVPDFVHPHALLYPLIGSKQIYNFNSFSDKSVDQLLTNASSEQVIEKQHYIYNKIIQKVSQQCVLGFLGSQDGIVYVSSEIEQPTFGQLGLHNLELSSIKLKVENNE